MPIPNPSNNEKQDAFIGRCMHALKDEKRPQNVKLAICFDKYKRAKKKANGAEPSCDCFGDKNFDIIP